MLVLCKAKLCIFKRKFSIETEEKIESCGMISSSPIRNQIKPEQDQTAFSETSVECKLSNSKGKIKNL